MSVIEFEEVELDEDWEDDEDDDEVFLDELTDSERREIIEGYVSSRTTQPLDDLAYDYSVDDYPYGYGVD